MSKRGASAFRAPALGAKFDLRGFHAAVLRHGPVSMATLLRIVDGWVSLAMPR